MSSIEEEIQRLQTAKANIKSALTARGLTVGSGETMSDFSADVSALPSVGGTAVTGISLNKATTSINVGSTETLTATITPDNATNKTVTWTSSDTNVATVANGVVTAVSGGSATITATSQEGRFTATCAVTSRVPVTGVSLAPSAITIDVGATSQLEGGVIPVNATDQQVTYTSSDETVATVSSTGLVTAISAGSATITITSHEGGFTATSAITCQEVAENYGTLTYYSSFERAVEAEPMECTVNDIDQDTFLAWYDEQEPSMMGEDRFMYESGTWTYNWETEIEDMSAIGIDVTLDEGTDFAEIGITIGYAVDKTSQLANFVIETETDYNKLTNNSMYNSVFDVNGGIPASAVKGFTFGSLATTTPYYFLGRCQNFDFIDMSEATGLTSIGSNFLDGNKTFDGEIEIPSTVTSIETCFLSQCHAFNHEIILPSGLTSLGGLFLYQCLAFNHEIVLPAGVTAISEQFLAYCSSFNQPLTIPSSVTSVGDSFLQSATSFNQPLTIPNSVTSVGKSFLGGCSIFNSSVTLPTGGVTIDASFMCDCSAFSQPLTIPSGTTFNASYGFFMYHCANFVGPLTIETNSMPSSYDSRYDLSTAATTDTMYVTGVALTGTYAQTWKNALPDRSTTPYRKLIVS